jgi:hypothetical protein
MAYASRTGTRRNLEALRAAGWGLMLSATGVHRTEGFERYALDNGACTAHQAGEAWDAGRFVALVDAFGLGADFVVVPDIVAGGLESLRRTEDWLPRLSGLRLVAVQDGMQPGDVRGLIGPSVGLFLGGSTDWKLETMRSCGEVAREAGCYFHVGRVNSIRRIRLCASVGADSFDGTSASKYAVTLPKLDKARRQSSWVW